MVRITSFRSVLLLSLVLLQAAWAVPAVRADPPRTTWFYEGGFVRNTGGNSWTETNWSGSYYFREVYRNADFIELFDASRSCTVRVYATQFYVRFGAEEFQMFYEGRWND